MGRPTMFRALALRRGEFLMIPMSSSIASVITTGVVISGNATSAAVVGAEYSATLAFAVLINSSALGPSSATTASCAGVSSMVGAGITASGATAVRAASTSEVLTSPSSSVASTCCAVSTSCSGVCSATGTTGVVSLRSPKPVERTPPPIRPPAIAASRYSAMASSLSISRPACARSIICWPTSVKPSVVAPPVARPVVRVSNPFQPVMFLPRGLRVPPNKSLPEILSSAAWPKVASRASPTSTLSLLPAVTSSSCRWTLLPNRIGACAVP